MGVIVIEIVYILIFEPRTEELSYKKKKRRMNSVGSITWAVIVTRCLFQKAH